jgi:hypothetical protein
MEPMKPLPGMKPMKPMEPMKPMAPMEPMRPLPFVNPGTSGERPWWPLRLGNPAAAGGQGDVRYAYFRDKKCLVIDRGGQLTLYDTADHDIRGVAQQQGGGRSELVFTSQRGTVRVDGLRVLPPALEDSIA